MDVSYPIKAVIPTLDGPVLEALAGTTRPLTGSEVHRLARSGSYNGVRNTLSRLVEHGIVYGEQRAAAIFYVANRDHLAWPAVELLVSMRIRLFEQVAAAVASWVLPALHASFFGSYARRDGNTESDIDVLIVQPDGVDEDADPWGRQVDELRQQVWHWTGNRCQAFQLDRQRLAEHVRVGDPIVDAWRRDCITFAGQDLRKLLSDLPVKKGNR